MGEKNGEKNSVRRTIAKCDAAVRADIQRSSDHLRATSIKIRDTGRPSELHLRAHHVKSMEQTRVTWPVMFAHPVIQLASAECLGGASFAEK